MSAALLTQHLRSRRAVFSQCLSIMLFTFAFAPVALGLTVWTGSTVDFSKLPFANSADSANQDFLTDSVIFARGPTAGLFNAASETGYNRTTFESPTGTLWAFEGLGGNPTGDDFGAAKFMDLRFDTWVEALGGPRNLVDNILGRAGVVHLIADDIYFDIEFTVWGKRPSSGAAVFYSRSSPVPLPGAFGLLFMGLAALRIPRKR